jgi:hypothetical protein
MPEVDVTGPAECREAEAERRDRKAGSSERARWQGHDPIPSGGVINLLTPEMLRHGTDLATVVGAPIGKAEGPALVKGLAKVAASEVRKAARPETVSWKTAAEVISAAVSSRLRDWRP